jgi:hypothetical protein
LPSYKSNVDFFAVLRGLIEHWCDRRCLKALLHVLPGYLSFNGMTDGWSELRNAIVQVRAFARDEITGDELEAVSDLIAAVDRLLA